MKKPIINTLMYRKADRYEPHRCVVEKNVTIPHTEFEQMRLHPVRDSTYIKEYKDLMYNLNAKNLYACNHVFNKKCPREVINRKSPEIRFQDFFLLFMEES